MIALTDELDIGRVASSAMTATRFAKDHSHRFDRLVVMNNVSTRVIARSMTAQIAKAYWFFALHLVPDLPEVLIAGREDIWLRHFFSDWCFNPHAISGPAFDHYVSAYRGTFDMAAVWAEMADDLRAGPILECGHLPHEEQPAHVTVTDDTDGSEAKAQREALFNEAANRGLLVGAAHIAFPGLGHVIAQNGQFVWLPSSSESDSGLTTGPAR
ncbi:MAG: hypothetical protein ACRYG8_14015 [Janthinobacterium lividum]